jgi:hypothetical protein
VRDLPIAVSTLSPINIQPFLVRLNTAFARTQTVKQVKMSVEREKDKSKVHKLSLKGMVCPITKIAHLITFL